MTTLLDLTSPHDRGYTNDVDGSTTTLYFSRETPFMFRYLIGS